MILLAHETEADVRSSAGILRDLGGRARRLLEECVEHQGVTRKSLSQAAQQLDEAGFVFVRETGYVGESSFAITPSLAGEEALEVLEVMEAGKPLACGETLTGEYGATQKEIEADARCIRDSELDTKKD